MKSADSMENIQLSMIYKVTENAKHFSSTSTFTFHSFTQAFISIGETSLQNEKSLKKKYSDFCGAIDFLHLICSLPSIFCSYLKLPLEYPI